MEEGSAEAATSGVAEAAPPAAAAQGGPASVAAAASADGAADGAKASAAAGQKAERPEGSTDGGGQEVLRATLEMRDILRDRGPEAAAAFFEEVRRRTDWRDTFRYSIFDVFSSEGLCNLLAETALPPSADTKGKVAEAVTYWSERTGCDSRATLMLRQLVPERRLVVMATLRVTPKTRNPSAALVGLCVGMHRLPPAQARVRERGGAAGGGVEPLPWARQLPLAAPMLPPLPATVQAAPLRESDPVDPDALFGIPLFTEEGAVPVDLLPPEVAQHCFDPSEGGAVHGYPPPHSWDMQAFHMPMYPGHAPGWAPWPLADFGGAH
eukprot:TRINITY_DN14553_c0_g1_i1.p2 TRINITY_DN14553_c0_g1~~TRINITY_DN14553_c0_g1_i1.p2  ORF type:complete len:324 (+),score=66.66 TRINITY_DN14553_c0_g1_i1:70-1041(+)